MFSTGLNSSGQLGNGSTTLRTNPVQVATGFRALAAGERHSLFVRTDGSLWSVGRNTEGQLGDGTTTQRTTPVLVAQDVALVCAGYNHTLFVKTNGTLWSMGLNDYGQIGNGSSGFGSNPLSPVQVATGVAAVAAGQGHSLFVKTDGTLWSMGRNDEGQLGDGTTTQRNLPVQIASGVVAAAAGQVHSLFVKGDGTLWAMGYNAQGQLGDGTTTRRLSPAQVASSVRKVVAGENHSLFLKNDNSLWGMGDNQFGMLGDGTTTGRIAPVGVALSVADVSAAIFHSLFLKADGTAWAMGYNAQGQLGDGSTTQRNTPVQVASNSTAVAAGDYHSLFLMGVAPMFSSQPISQSVSVGGSASFSISGAASSPLLVSWRKNGALVSGATNSSLSVPAVQAGDAGNYDVVLSNSFGSITSSIAVLTVVFASPIITTQPQNQSVLVGASAGFSVVASGSPPLFFQWRRGGAVLLGATNSSLNIPSVTVSDAGGYDVLVSNEAGTVASIVATLTLLNVPQVINAPSSVSVTVGGTASFTVGASGTAPLSYQWRKSGLPLAGATSATLTLNLVQPVQAGLYDVVVTNAFGAVTSSPPAVLSVGAPPSITFASGGPTLSPGGSVTLAVPFAAGTSYQWQSNGTNVTGAVGAALTITNATLNNVGRYTVQVTDGTGTTLSQPVEVSLFGDLRMYAGTILAGTQGNRYRIEYADVLGGVTNWVAVTNLVHPGGTLLFVDPNSPGRAQRFYRAVLEP